LSFVSVETNTVALQGNNKEQWNLYFSVELCPGIANVVSKISDVSAVNELHGPECFLSS